MFQSRAIKLEEIRKMFNSKSHSLLSKSSCFMYTAPDKLMCQTSSSLHECSQCTYVATTCQSALFGICCMFSGQRWSGWTRRRQRKPWQKSECYGSLYMMSSTLALNRRHLVLINIRVFLVLGSQRYQRTSRRQRNNWNQRRPGECYGNCLKC